MTLPATNARFGYIALTFAALSLDLDLRTEEEQRLFQARDQFLVLAGIGL
jgi:hypothetical protein